MNEDSSHSVYSSLNDVDYKNSTATNSHPNMSHNNLQKNELTNQQSKTMTCLGMPNNTLLNLPSSDQEKYDLKNFGPVSETDDNM
jgi:hypothetical protein